MNGAPSTGTIVQFWYEFASTYSYPAAMRVEASAAAQGVVVSWRPFLLGPIFAELGWTTSPFNLQPAKGRYMWRDLARICAREGLAFVRPEPFPQNTLLAARVAMALPDGAQRAAFTRAVYQAEFELGLTISDHTVLANALAQAGDVEAEALRLAETPDVKLALRAATEEAQAVGLFGAPTFVTPDGELFWGFDRMDEAMAWARNADTIRVEPR